MRASNAGEGVRAGVQAKGFVGESLPLSPDCSGRRMSRDRLPGDEGESTVTTGGLVTETIESGLDFGRLGRRGRGRGAGGTS